MKRYELEITETDVYFHRAVVEVEDDVDMDTICNKFDKYAERFDDIYYTDDWADGKVRLIEVDEDGSPACDIETTNYEEVTK